MQGMKRFKSIAVSVLIVSLLASPLNQHNTSQVSAESSDAIKVQIDTLKEELLKIEGQLSDVQQQYQETENEIANIIGQKNVIDQQINLLSMQIRIIDEQINTYKTLIADKQDEYDAAMTQYEQLKEKYKLRIRAMEECGSLNYWQVIFKANSFTDLLDRLNMMQEIAAADKRCLNELSLAAEEVKEAQDELNLKKEEQERIKEELKDKNTALELKKAAADELLQIYIVKANELDGLIAEFEAVEEAFLKEIANKETEYDEAKKKEWEEFNNANNTGANASDWRVPCSFVYLSSPFGYRDAPVAGASTYHQGVDLAAYRGTPVYATRSGIVSIADHGWSAGNYVQIDHQDGYKSIYMHLETYSVSAGDVVAAGQQIGTVGTSGVSSGYHLHFGISYNNVYVNPCDYVTLHS